jgi:hypothetical protein
MKHVTTVRALCSLLGLMGVFLACSAFVRDDPRDVIGYVGLTLLALVLWLSVRPGAAKFLQAPTGGDRAMRTALYLAMLGSAVVATSRWPAGLDDGRGSDAALVLMFAGWMTGRFLPNKERGEATA